VAAVGLRLSRRCHIGSTDQSAALERTPFPIFWIGCRQSARVVSRSPGRGSPGRGNDRSGMRRGPEDLPREASAGRPSCGDACSHARSPCPRATIEDGRVLARLAISPRGRRCWAIAPLFRSGAAWRHGKGAAASRFGDARDHRSRPDYSIAVVEKHDCLEVTSRALRSPDHRETEDASNARE
jgi:hypothetical protein